MIYVFTYRRGELKAEVEAETEEEALDTVVSGDTNVTVNVEMLNPTMWTLADAWEEN